MTKREFLKQLRGCLHQLNENDRDQVLLYWSEAIDDRLEAGMTEEQIFAELESPDVIALRILSELHNAANQAQQVPQPEEDQSQCAAEGNRQAECEARRAEQEARVARREELEKKQEQLEERQEQLESRQSSLENKIEVLEDDDAPSELEQQLLDVLRSELRALESELSTLETELSELESELDELDDVEDEEEDPADEARDESGFGFNIRIPDIKIPDIHIPEIRIPEIKLPDFEGKDWYFGIGEKGTGFYQGGEDSKFRRRHLDANAATVRELRVIDHNNDIELQPSADDRIHIHWSENANHKYEVSGEKGVLTLTHLKPGFLERMFGASRRENVVVELPAGFGGLVSMNTSNAGIKAASLRLSGLLDLNTSNSSLKAEDVCAGRLRCVTSNSKIALASSQAEEMELKTSNSNLKLEKVWAKTLSARTSNSSIKANGVDAMFVTLITSNGSISGELAGRPQDYTIESSTSNGKNHNPSQPGGDRKLEVRTSNGNISLDYLG